MGRPLDKVGGKDGAVDVLLLEAWLDRQPSPQDLHDWKGYPRMFQGPLVRATESQGFCLASGKRTKDMIGDAGSCAQHGLACDSIRKLTCANPHSL